MSLRDLFTMTADLLRDPEHGFGESVTMFDKATVTPTESTFDAIVEFTGDAPLLRTSEAEESMEPGTIEVPTSVTVTDKCYFVRANGERLNFNGFGGRDADLQTILVLRVISKNTRTARRRNS